MSIIVNVDVMMAKRKMSSGELADKIGITQANLSILKTGKAKAIRFSTLDAICKALDCQPGDILEYRSVKKVPNETFPFGTFLLYLCVILEQTMKTNQSIVIIPTYNEKENIENIIRAVMALEDNFNILIIDDGSPDGTAAIVKGLMETDFKDRLFIVERSGKLGLGTAYITGFKWCIERGYDYIFEMDADFSHAPSDLPRLLSACRDEGYDVAIGSRYVSGVNVVNWPMGRVLMSYFASKYVHFVTGLPVHDTTAGFKCYRRQVLETIELDKIHFKGYAFQIEMKFTAYKCGFKIKEVPVIFVNRELGTSKMSGGIFSEALFGVIRLKIASWFRKYPQKPQAPQA